MVTFEELRKIYLERLDALEWAEKWSPYALEALESEYNTMLDTYASQENITREEVINKLTQ